MKPTRVTIREVAAHAGVSVATVSRALNGNRPMSEELRQRVLDSAATLDYQVNLLGRALRKRLPVLGLSVPDLENPFFASLAEQLNRTVQAAGFELLVSSAGGSLEAEAGGVQAFLGRQLHAVVIIPCDERGSAPTVNLAAGRALTVQLDREVDDSRATFVGCDNREGMNLVARHVGASRRDDRPVVFVGAGLHSSSARERLAGFEEHFPGAASLLGDFTLAWGIEAADQLLESGMDTATVVAAADIIALGVISRLRARGARLPDDFEVIGFDGIGAAAFAHPPLTTVRQPVEEMAEAILAIIQHPPTPREDQDGQDDADRPAGERRRLIFSPTFVGGA